MEIYIRVCRGKLIAAAHIEIAAVSTDYQSILDGFLYELCEIFYGFRLNFRHIQLIVQHLGMILNGNHRIQIFIPAVLGRWRHSICQGDCIVTIGCLQSTIRLVFFFQPAAERTYTAF